MTRDPLSFLDDNLPVKPEFQAEVERSIAALERHDHKLVLLWRDERGTEIWRTGQLVPGTRRIAIPPDARSVDLLEERP